MSSRFSATVTTGLLAFALLLLSACGGGGEETVAVESGTYTGTINEVVPEESEIYVNLSDTTGTLELYFTDSTQVTQGGTTVPFDSLAQGQSVEVTVEKIGQRMNPISVRINP